MLRLKKLFFILIIFFYNSFSFSQIEIKYKIDEEIITNIDILNEKKYLLFLRPNLSKLPENEILKISRDTLVREIIKKKEIDKVFKKQPNEKFLNEIKNNLFKFKKVKNEDEFRNLLRKNGIKYNKIIEKVKYEALWNDLIFRKFNPLVKINRNKLKEKLRDQLKNNKKYEYNLSELLFEVDKSENFDSKYLRIINYINSTTFKNAASKFSIAGSNNKGGQIGWIKETLLSKKLSKILKKMKINEITTPIEYPNGYLILKINNKREMKQIKDINKELEDLVKFERNNQLNQFSLLYYKKLKQNTKINEN